MVAIGAIVEVQSYSYWISADHCDVTVTATATATVHVMPTSNHMGMHLLLQLVPQLLPQLLLPLLFEALISIDATLPPHALLGMRKHAGAMPPLLGMRKHAGAMPPSTLFHD